MSLSLIYIVMPLITIFIIPHIQIGRISRYKTILFFFAISYILMCGLRDGGGADDESYRLYYEMGYGGEIFQIFTDKEPLFNLLRFFCYALNLNYKGLFLCYAIITILFVCLALKNLNLPLENLVLYIAAFYFIAFSGMFTAMRQAAAMAIVFYIYSCKNLSILKRIVLWLLIVCTHYGFVLLILIEIVLCIFRYHFSNLIIISILVISVAIGMFIRLDNLVQQITSMLGLFDYMNDAANYDNVAGIGIVTWFLLILYFLKNIIYNKSTGVKLTTNDNFNKSAIAIDDKANMAQMLYFVLIAITQQMRWGNRIAYYYLLFVPFLMVDAANYVRLNNTKVDLSWLIKVILYIGFELLMFFYFGEDGYVWSIKIFN